MPDVCRTTVPTDNERMMPVPVHINGRKLFIQSTITIRRDSMKKKLLLLVPTITLFLSRPMTVFAVTEAEMEALGKDTVAIKISLKGGTHKTA